MSSCRLYVAHEHPFLKLVGATASSLNPMWSVTDYAIATLAVPRLLMRCFLLRNKPRIQLHAVGP